MSDVANRLREKKRELSRMIREAERLAGDDPVALRAQAHRDLMARRSRQQTAAVSEIGEYPAVVDQARRDACERDLAKFLREYFPQSTGRAPFSPDHIRVIHRIQTCILDGGLFINALPRGFAKTTITENAAIWAVLYGHRRFVPVFGSDAGSAAGNIDSIKLELAENSAICGDFPEVCHAIQQLDNKPQRCRSQTYKGILTHIEWTADTIVLPTIEGSRASGGIVTAHGITAAMRGMKHKRPDGKQQRPDFVLVDDPQTDESAGSDLQISKRLEIIRKSILKLGGHDRRIACVVNATVIRPKDLIEQLLDPAKFPAWQGERIKMVKAWSAAHETLWLGDYQRLRNTYDGSTLGDQQRAHREATAFYERNREAMDSGCSVTWEHCYDQATELSAIQHAYNSLIDDGPEVFASECQNEPFAAEIENAAEMMSADAIAAKTNGLERGMAPLATTRVVAYIDVQKPALPWLVYAADESFGGSIIDYGTWPDQRKTYFAFRDIPRRMSIAGVTKIDGLEPQIYAALDALVGQLASREFRREDGAALKLERIGIDANWGESTDVVYQFCRQSPHSALLLPGHGRFVGASSARGFNEYQRKPGDKVGLNWRMPTVQNRRSIRYMLFDTNYWKSFVHSRLSTPSGGRGCLMLNGSDAREHQLVADHLTSEQGVKVEARGRSVIEWKWKPGRPDNHWLDCLVGCHVLASERGAQLIERVAPIARKVVKFADRVKTRRTWRANA